MISNESAVAARGGLRGRVARLLAVPTFADLEKDRVARILTNILRVTLTLIVAVAAAQIVVAGPSAGMLSLLVAWLWTAGLYALLKRGYVQAAALLLLLNLLLLVNAPSIGFGGIYSPSIGGNLLIILMATVTVSTALVVLVSALTIAAMSGVYYVHVHGLAEALAIPKTPLTPEIALMTHVVHIIAAGYFLYLAIHSLQEALARARREEQRAAALLDEMALARQAAESANLAKSRFLANMSHELRTPLNAVLGYAEMLLEESDPRATLGEARSDLQKIHGAGVHLQRLIGEILDLSKIEAGRMQLEAAPVAIDEVVAEVVAAIGPLLAENRDRLEVTVEPGLSVIGDRSRIYQVVLNVAANAAKFTTDGVVTLSATREAAAPGVLVTVRDTGIGIAKDQLPLIFERFHQADDSATRRHGGTGLGLAIAAAFAEMMGGSITAESELGVGSRFCFFLPASPPAPPASPA
jgi:signal transduction histidine kinase